MTFLGKCLTAFVFFASLSFMGFAAVVAFGGRNWESMIPDLGGYSFTNTGGSNPNWTAQRIRKKQSIKESKNLPEVLVAVLKDKVNVQQEEISALDAAIPDVRKILDEVNSLISADIAAMLAREKELADELNVLNRSIEEVVNKGRVQTQAAQQKRIVGELRREDVFRLQKQLDEVRTDRFRAEEQRRKLQDALVQMNGSVERLEERNQQLKATLY